MLSFTNPPLPQPTTIYSHVSVEGSTALAAVGMYETILHAVRNGRLDATEKKDMALRAGGSQGDREAPKVYGCLNRREGGSR